MVSVPFGYFSLNEIDQYKIEKGWKIEKYFWSEKEKFLELEKAALKNCPRIDFLNNILDQVLIIVDINSTKFDRNTKFLYKEERPKYFTIYFKTRMEEKYTCDGQFNGNILVIGRKGCGKTTFIQKLGANNFFGNRITDVFWVSKIVLSSEREDQIRDSFIDQKVHFSYPNNLDDFNYLVGNFTQDKTEYVDSELGENLPINKLIIMDDVSGLADKSQDFLNFLTVSRKYGFSCVYVFHTIYPDRQNWEMIMSQTHIFNFFSRIYSQ